MVVRQRRLGNTNIRGAFLVGLAAPRREHGWIGVGLGNGILLILEGKAAASG